MPADAATASGSGLYLHITPANARTQIARAAAARGVDDARIAALLADVTEAPLLGIWGEPRVNVLPLDQLVPPAR